MATINPKEGFGSHGIAGRFTDTINAKNAAIFAGYSPPPVDRSFTAAVGQTLSSRQVVGFDTSGHLVPATRGTPDDGAAATGTLTFSGTGSDTDTVVIGGRTYTLKTSLSTGPTVANEVLIGANATETGDNLVDAINGNSANIGTTYSEGTAEHPAVTASNSSGTVTVTARFDGDAGNEVVTTETSASDASWGSGTLTGGDDGDYIGIVPVGVVIEDVDTTDNVEKKTGVYVQGAFRMDALTWDVSFDTEAKKVTAFDHSPHMTNVVIRPRGVLDPAAS